MGRENLLNTVRCGASRTKRITHNRHTRARAFVPKIMCASRIRCALESTPRVRCVHHLLLMRPTLGRAFASRLHTDAAQLFQLQRTHVPHTRTASTDVWAAECKFGASAAELAIWQGPSTRVHSARTIFACGWATNTNDLTAAAAAVRAVCYYPLPTLRGS